MNTVTRYNDKSSRWRYMVTVQAQEYDTPIFDSMLFATAQSVADWIQDNFPGVPFQWDVTA